MTLAASLRFITLSYLAFTSLAFAAGTNGTVTDPRRCGSEVSDEKVQADEAHFQSLLAATPNLSKANSAAASVTIPVYFHVIQAGPNLNQGNVPIKQINDQMTVINNDFAGTGLTFNLVKVDRTVNQAWFRSVGPGTDKKMKRSLRLGGPRALNVYTVGLKAGPGKDLLGYATFPNEYKAHKWLDGVVLKYDTLPGGSSANYDLGRTLTHEIGHWVGLYHTFQGACKGGDQVQDTPPEGGPAYGCPEGRNTCAAPGLDPIHNFMDYGYDSCLTEFTPGQIQRLQRQMSVYRGASF